MATDDTITAYDKSHTPPEDDSLGVAVFFLSLLCSNQKRYGGNDFERVVLWKAWVNAPVPGSKNLLR